MLIIAESFFVNFLRQQISDDSLQVDIANIYKNNWSKTFVIFSSIQLILLYSLRAIPDDARLDLYRYALYFNSMAGDGNSFLEPGFRYYCYILSILGDSTPYILFAFSFPTITLIMWFIYRYSKNVYLSVYIYYGFMFYFFLFNGVRQCMAISIGLLAYHFINQKRWIIAALCIMLAVSFHYSALILLALYVAKNLRIKVNLIYFITLLLICGVLIVSGKYLSASVTMLVAGGYSGYLGVAGYGDEGNIANPIIYMIISSLICFLYHKQDSENNFFINALSLGTMFYALSVQVHVLNRMAYYFTIVVICVLPNVLNQVKNLNLRLWCIVGCYLAITIYGMLLILKNAHGILPYELGF